MARAIGSAGERLVHTEEVTGSIPVSPTSSQAGSEIAEPALFIGVQQQRKTATGSSGKPVAALAKCITGAGEGTSV